MDTSDKNTEWLSEELRTALKNTGLLHPVAGKKDLFFFFRAHSGFLYFAGQESARTIETLRDLKKELDPLGIQLIMVTSTPMEDEHILIVNEPSLFGQPGIEDNRIVFIEEGFGKAFFVDSIEEILPTAARYIELDEQSEKHLPPGIKKVLRESRGNN
jgi:hypothetical protein